MVYVVAQNFEKKLQKVMSLTFGTALFDLCMLILSQIPDFTNLASFCTSLEDINLRTFTRF